MMYAVYILEEELNFCVCVCVSELEKSDEHGEKKKSWCVCDFRDFLYIDIYIFFNQHLRRPFYENIQLSM